MTVYNNTITTTITITIYLFQNNYKYSEKGDI